MIIPEPQPAEPKLERRPFQFSLRSLFGLTCGTAAFFSLARTLGYADAVVILAAIVVAVGVMEYPRRVHLPTAILLTLVAGTLLWANLRPTRWQKDLGSLLPPDRLDFVTKGMFFRGWPLSPCMICLYHGMRFHPEEGAVPLALVFDGVAFALALCVVRGVCEFCIRRRAKAAIATPPDTEPPSDPPPACAARPRGG